MATTPVARRYARALVELGAERNILDKLTAQARAFSGLYEGSRELKNVLLNPSIKLEERRNIVRSLVKRAGWDPMFQNFVLLLLDKDRIRHITAIADELEKMADERLGNVRAKVTSASALDRSEQDAIKRALEAMTGKNVLIDTQVDPSLLGGVVTHLGGTVYDGSVRTQLGRIRDAILKEV
jgi:F-type H+-transporting ATPase subunit delta